MALSAESLVTALQVHRMTKICLDWLFLSAAQRLRTRQVELPAGFHCERNVF
jgi:hypothetical protein